ncbi:MAG: hypothetical protein B7X35_06825 [Halothiobacillus sp. 14-56-357]|jgi:hypothetical protein|uniref:hypothetical protein n=1 Tax=Halothiobacillus sp. 15-55-196 TaxID=1970382 RepID=UPI000BCD3EE0|nr:hypothetical protein [Halothiobacillus sp. 15-55-196]OZB35339.1 MAG: hypothetical protein B7X44_10240 [Halothiobacillus sp. 15-55-196]OZB56142.1 MAG: hypothetical protein B7X35_06825 [Halothiobacillus sp. 14-56-357]OZB77877.1 MAG: hypothetical protein B7X29_06985 [Halothiobacillus sp. 13-55-115]
MNHLVDGTAHTTSIDWAEVYAACRLHLVGISYAHFIEAPEEVLNRLGMQDALEIMAAGFLPLLPVQAKVRQEIDAPKPVQKVTTAGIDHKKAILRATGVRALSKWMSRAS